MNKYLYLIIIMSLASGCQTTNTSKHFQETNRSIQPNIIENQTKMASLTVNSTPGSTVKIMNIKPKYKDGIQLNKGKYHIQVSKTGHETYQKWISITKDTNMKVNLNKISSHIAMKSIQKSKIDYSKYVTEIIWDFHNEAYSLHYDGATKLIWAVQDALLDNALKNNLKPFSGEVAKDYLRFGIGVTITGGDVYIPFVDGLNRNGKHLLLHIPAKKHKENYYKDEYIIGSIDDLGINGIKHAYSLPSKSEFVKSKKLFKEVLTHYKGLSWHYRYSEFADDFSISFSTKPFKYSEYRYAWSQSEATSIGATKKCDNKHKRCIKVNGFNKSVVFEPNLPEDKTIPFFLVRKPTSQYEKIIFSDLSNVEKIKRLISLITAEKLKVSLEKVEKPRRPKAVKANKLFKDEFETTSEFSLRQENENNRAHKINNQNKDAYLINIIKYNQSVNQALDNYNKALQKNKEEQVIRMAANEAAKQAITMLFGDPKFKNFSYDADNETFSMSLYSLQNSFSNEIEVPKPLAKAKAFKSSLADQLYVPSVKFKLENDKLKFSSISVVDNSFKQNQDFNYAEVKDTVSSYRDFLSIHPRSPQASQAKSRIKQIHQNEAERKRNAEIAAETRAKKAAKAKERERKAYMKNKNIGDKVCMDGSMAFGFITPTITAFVENKNGSNIQLRIADTEGTSPHYNGVTLRRNLLIWDDYYSWKHCN